MDPLALIARTIIAIVLLISAIAKFADPEGTRRAVVGFGLPRRSARPIAILLPACELLIGIGLIVGPVRPAAIAALMLIGAFTIVVGVSLARGSHPACACFGAASTAPIGPMTFVRNLALLALGIIALLGDDRSPLAWLESASTSDRAIVAIVMVIGGLVIVATRSLRRRPGRPLRDRIPRP